MKTRNLAVALVSALVLVSSLAAQLTSGVIAGAIRDTQELPIANARIAFRNESTGQLYEVHASELGDYSARALPLGTYTVSVEQTGFKRYSRTGIGLTAGQVLRIDIRLEVGALSETVHVTAEVPPVNVTTATLDTLIDDRRLVDLPLKGRNALGLAALMPGVTRVSLASGLTSDSVESLNVQGNRAYSTNVMLDGASMYYGHRGQALTEPPPDAVAELKVITSGVPAEYGRGSAMISAVTKGGTNEYHGAVWNYFRNDKLDARSFFATSVPKLRYNQFGGTLGGPVRRNKAFFFGAYQGRESRSDSVRSNAFPPTAAERGGDFTGTIGSAPRDPLTRQPFPGAIIPKDRLDPVAQKLAERFPLPNRPNGGYVVQKSVPTGSWAAVGRGDYDFTPRDRTTARYFIDRQHLVNPFPAGSNVDGYTSAEPNHQAQNLGLSHTHVVSPVVLLTGRFGYTQFRYSEPNTVRDTLATLGSKFVTGGGPGSLPQLTISGRLSPQSALEIFRKLSVTTEAASDLSWIRGKHELKFGGFFYRLRYWSHQSGRAYGVFTFDGSKSGNPMADFFLGAASQLRQEGVRSNDVVYWSYGAFAQDRWRATPRLTLSFGLRWELYTPWRAVDGAFHAFVPGARSTTFPTAPAGVVWQDDAGFPYQTDAINLGPRFGFAYDVFGTGKTSLRGGYGVSYDPLIGQIAAQNAQPFGADVATNNVGPLTDPQRYIDNPYTKPLDLKNPKWTLPWVMTTSFKGTPQTAYSQNLNLTVEQQVAANTLVQASYVASIGRKVGSGGQINPAIYIPGQSTSQNIDQRRIYWPTFGSIYAYSTDSNSAYHALQAVLNRRFSKGHTVLVSYAFGKAIDEVTTAEAANWGGQNPADRRGDRGLGDYDIRHRLVVSWLWELPFLRQTPGVPGKVFGGWQFSGIATVQDGMPFTVTSGRDNSLQGVNIPYGADRPDLLGDPKLPSDRSKDERLARYFDTSKFVMNRQGQFGNAGRNLLIGPGDCGFDFTLNKKVRLWSEKKILEIRWDVFNAFNRASFSNPGSNLSGAATFGKITSAGSGRVMQLALRFEF